MPQSPQPVPARIEFPATALALLGLNRTIHPTRQLGGRHLRVRGMALRRVAILEGVFMRQLYPSSAG